MPHVAVLVLVNAFVGSLYAMPRRVRDLPRNDPTHVAWRIAAVSCVCAVSPLVYAVAMFCMDAHHPWGFRQWLGAAPQCNGLSAVGTCVAAMQALFLGPLVQQVMHQAGGLPTRNAWAWDMRSLRDFIVAPFAEEWIFRFTILPVYLASGYSVAGALTQTAVWFGLAHVHHFRDMRRRGVSSSQALVSVLVQLSYTSVFAWLCGHFAAHTGSMLGATLMHALANVYGLPQVGFLADLARGHGVGRNGALLVAYLCGVAAFVMLWRHASAAAFPCSMVRPA